MIHIANYNASRYEGWIRTTVDHAVPFDAGEVDGVEWVRGHSFGVGVTCIDLRVDLRGYSTAAIDLRRSIERPFRREHENALLERFGAVAVNGVPMRAVRIEPDGAGHAVHLRARIGRMFVVDLRLQCPSRQAWACGVVTVACSNPAVEDMGETLEWLRLELDRGMPVFPAGIGLPTRFADSQSRSWPVTPLAIGGALPNCTPMLVCAIGCERPSPWGAPHVPAEFDRLAWSRGHLYGALGSQSTWAPHPGIGPNPRSADTGAQADMVFPGGEATGLAGVGAELVRWLVALSQGRRPCHHLDLEGDLYRLWDPRVLPNLRIWDGRAHWHPNVSPEQLGKPRSLREDETMGWWGPDPEHWRIGNLAVAARLTGDPTLQWILEAQAGIYFRQWTVEPGVATSQPYASRAVGWEAMAVVELFRTLRDRALADRVAMHWKQRWDEVVGPAYNGKDVVDVRTDDPRLGPGPWVISWQQAVAAYGLDVAGKQFGRLAARVCALRLARWVLDNAWRQDGDRWVSAPVLPLSTTDETPSVTQARRHVHEDAGIPLPETDATPVFDESFNRFGMPLAVAVVLRHDPNDARARAILAQLLADGGGSWIAPEIVNL